VTQVVVTCCGHSYTTAVTIDGTLYTWGDGQYGALGQGDAKERLLPTPVDPASVGGAPVTWVSCGSEFMTFTLAVTSAGEVFACGANEYGQLGLGDTKGRLAFANVDRKCFEGGDVVQTACGHVHAAAVARGGRLYMWGQISDGTACKEPRRLAGTVLGETTVGRSRGLPSELAMAFAMATHHRLGHGSAAGGLLGELVQLIVMSGGSSTRHRRRQARVARERKSGAEVCMAQVAGGCAGGVCEVGGKESGSGEGTEEERVWAGVLRAWDGNSFSSDRGFGARVVGGGGGGGEREGAAGGCANASASIALMRRLWPMGFGRDFGAFGFLA
jgi:hypothetical protein